MSSLDRAVACPGCAPITPPSPTGRACSPAPPWISDVRSSPPACCERVVDGAYAFGGVDADELARCAALCGSRPHLVVAGPTAGRLWGLAAPLAMAWST